MLRNALFCGQVLQDGVTVTHKEFHSTATAHLKNSHLHSVGFLCMKKIVSPKGRNFFLALYVKLPNLKKRVHNVGGASR